MESLLEKYTQLNNSFRKKKLTYRIGVDAGFFSEYNNMILAMLYCLENKIHFKLYSKDANFKYENGWTDYFLPFCKEDSGYQRHNPRSAVLSKKYDIRVILHHILKPNTFLTFELWDTFRDRNREQKHYIIPELGINGDLQHACQVLINLTWRYNDTTQAAIDRLVSSLPLPEKYIGFHIRSGDKIKEAKLVEIPEYIEKVKLYSNIQTVFVSTDNHSIIEKFQEQFKDWKLFTLSDEKERGYFQDEFNKMNKDPKKQHYENLFASINILKKADVFVGTFSSNIGMFLGMQMQKDKVFSVDLEKWQII